MCSPTSCNPWITHLFVWSKTSLIGTFYDHNFLPANPCLQTPYVKPDGHFRPILNPGNLRERSHDRQPPKSPKIAEYRRILSQITFATIQLVKFLHCKLPTFSKQPPTFPHRVKGLNHIPQRWNASVLPLHHHGPIKVVKEGFLFTNLLFKVCLQFCLLYNYMY